VVINLIANAMRAVKVVNGVGQIRLDIMQDEAFVRIRVSNNGPSLAPEHAERIMHRATPIPAEGMGLGLPISKILAQKQGGDLIVLPGLYFDSGTTFQFSLLKKKEGQDGENIAG
jgi:C4-dicarboxylate-specific signal transduction histidine kinase